MSSCNRLLVVLAQHCVIGESKYPKTWTKNIQLNNSAAIFGFNKYRREICFNQSVRSTTHYFSLVSQTSFREENSGDVTSVGCFLRLACENIRFSSFFAAGTFPSAKSEEKRMFSQARAPWDD